MDGFPAHAAYAPVAAPVILPYRDCRIAWATALSDNLRLSGASPLEGGAPSPPGWGNSKRSVATISPTPPLPGADGAAPSIIGSPSGRESSGKGVCREL